MKLLREWKKVIESDLESLMTELEDSLERPSVIILTGDLGAGKTTFSQSFVKLFGESDTNVASPTYSIINDFENIVHADFYRLKDSSEIDHLELSLYLEDKEFFLIEWGRSHLEEILKYVEEEAQFFEVVIEIPEGPFLRNYSLYKLEPEDF